MARGSGFPARRFTLAAMRNPDSTRTVHTKTWIRLRLKRFRSSMRAPRQNPVTPLPMSAVSTTSKAIVANQARSIDLLRDEQRDGRQGHQQQEQE